MSKGTVRLAIIYLDKYGKRAIIAIENQLQ